MESQAEIPLPGSVIAGITRDGGEAAALRSMLHDFSFLASMIAFKRLVQHLVQPREEREKFFEEIIRLWRESEEQGLANYLAVYRERREQWGMLRDVLGIDLLPDPDELEKRFKILLGKTEAKIRNTLFESRKPTDENSGSASGSDGVPHSDGPLGPGNGPGEND